MPRTLLYIVVAMLCAIVAPALAQRPKGGEPKGSQPARPDVLLEQASLWDANHDGVYTCDEWKQHASRLFNLADRNHNGYLDAGEFKTIQEAYTPLRDADLSYFDGNGDGRVSRDEFVNKPNPLFARYDKDGDCRVTPDELRAASAPPARPGGGKRDGGRGPGRF